jgi:hypothetical protein
MKAFAPTFRLPASPGVLCALDEEVHSAVRQLWEPVLARIGATDAIGLGVKREKVSLM